MKSLTSFAAGALCGLALSALSAETSEPVNVEKLQTMSATVESIDIDKRLIELRPEGEKQSTTVQVPPEVRNLSQVKVGDEVVVQYYQGLAAQLKKKGETESMGAVESATGAARRPEGQKPGGAVGNVVTATVVIQAVDRDANSVTFTGPAGKTRTVEVKDPRAQKFISTLKKGDQVELTYTEALAVTVEPQKQKP